MERKQKQTKKRHVAAPAKKTTRGPGMLSKTWEFVKSNAKGIADTVIFAAAAGAIYGLGEGMGNFFMKQLPTEESTREYYNQLLAEARGVASQ